MTFYRGGNHLLTICQAPIQPETCLCSQLPEEFPLGTAISFTKRMKRIQFPQKIGSALDVLFALQAFQAILFLQLSEEIIQILGQKLRRGKRERTGLLNIDLAHLASPGVDFRENCAMNRLKMLSVKAPLYRIEMEPGQGIRSSCSLITIEKRLLRYAGDIAQHAVLFIEVGIGTDRIDTYGIYTREFK